MDLKKSLCQTKLSLAPPITALLSIACLCWYIMLVLFTGQKLAHKGHFVCTRNKIKGGSFRSQHPVLVCCIRVSCSLLIKQSYLNFGNKVYCTFCNAHLATKLAYLSAGPIYGLFVSNYGHLHFVLLLLFLLHLKSLIPTNLQQLWYRVLLIVWRVLWALWHSIYATFWKSK